jgi:hypothetical protein
MNRAVLTAEALLPVPPAWAKLSIPSTSALPPLIAMARLFVPFGFAELPGSTAWARLLVPPGEPVPPAWAELPSPLAVAVPPSRATASAPQPVALACDVPSVVHLALPR